MNLNEATELRSKIDPLCDNAIASPQAEYPLDEIVPEDEVAIVCRKKI